MHPSCVDARLMLALVAHNPPINHLAAGGEIPLAHIIILKHIHNYPNIILRRHPLKERG